MGIHIILVRHGQTGWNVQSRFRGTADIALNEAGVAQAEAVARRLQGESIAAIYTSPLQRARHTADIVAGPHGLPVREVPAFRSVDYGQWEGQLEEDVAQQYPHLYRLYRNRPDQVQFPGGESLGLLRDRAMRALMDLLPRHVDQRIAVVTHQVVTRTILCAVLGLSDAHYWHLAQDNACINRFSYDADGFCLQLLNDTCHLEDLPLPEEKGAA
ncbi:MAG: histidine phosphatase family protein [Chloroflexi bacterium]|nr:histidine phosphatase family protein [Chloroflexota bacterium]